VDGDVLALASNAALQTKQQVHILGFPVGLPLSLTEGVISHTRQLLDEQFYLQTDAAINPGNSGGPMLDSDKRIIAVTTCKLNSADSVGFGIPVDDVRTFIEDFRAQQEEFGVQCPACNNLIVRAVRYCPSCGTDLESDYQLADYFDPPEQHPLVNFVERSLAAANVDPVLARHGNQNWSFHFGSAPIKIWCCCSEHLNFSSPMVQTGSRDLDALFRFLLAAEHAPYAFDVNGSTVRMNLVVHIADIFAAADHPMLAARVGEFIRKADLTDNLLIKQYGCKPAPETQMDFLGGHGSAA
jgi:serine protease Do